jgi:hypothetical protein
MSGPSTLHQDKEKITAMTPSKPNLLPIGTSFFVYVIVRFILVMVLMILSVVVREAMI